MTDQIDTLIGRIEAEMDISLDAHSACHWNEKFRRRRALTQRVEIEQRIAEFTHQASLQEWPSQQHYQQRLIQFWFQIQEEICCNYDLPTDESRCDDRCRAAMSLITISEELRLYGCVNHGTMHVCGGRCRSVTKTRQWTAVCIFSGAEVDKFLSSAREAKFDGSDHMAGFKYAVSLNEFDALPDYEYRRAHDDDPILQRVTTKSSLGTVKRQIDAKKSEREQTNQFKQTWRFRRVVSEITNEAERKLRSISDKVAEDVLFDQDTRVLYNSLQLDQAPRTAQMRMTEYFSQCRMQESLPNEIQSRCIYETAFKSIVLLPLLDDDRIRKSRFSTLCSRLWAICHRSPFAQSIAPRAPNPQQQQQPPRFRGSNQSRHSVRQTTCLFEQFCLGVLFSMRYGVVIKTCDPHLYIQREFRFVPCDKRLQIDLPREECIDMFGERGRNELVRNSEPVAQTVQYGESSKQNMNQSSLFKQNGTRKVRKARTKRRVTTVGSGSRRIPQLRNAAISEREVLPPHLHSSLLVTHGYYEKHDITRGRNFLRECLNSFSEQDLERESRSLSY